MFLCLFLIMSCVGFGGFCSLGVFLMGGWFVGALSFFSHKLREHLSLKKESLVGLVGFCFEPAPVLATNWGAFESNTGAGQGFCLGDCLKEKKLLLHSCGSPNETASCPCVRLKYFFHLWLTPGQVLNHARKTNTAPRSSTQMPLQFVANSWRAPRQEWCQSPFQPHSKF